MRNGGRAARSVVNSGFERSGAVHTLRDSPSALSVCLDSALVAWEGRKFELSSPENRKYDKLGMV